MYPDNSRTFGQFPDNFGTTAVKFPDISRFQKTIVEDNLFQRYYWIHTVVVEMLQLLWGYNDD